jgi:hypothetical protein
MSNRSRGRRLSHRLDQFDDFGIVRAERRLFEDGGDDWKNVAGHEATLPILCKGTELKPEGIRPDATFIDHGSVSSRRKNCSFVCESATPAAQKGPRRKASQQRRRVVEARQAAAFPRPLIASGRQGVSTVGADRRVPAEDRVQPSDKKRGQISSVRAVLR